MQKHGVPEQKYVLHGTPTVDFLYVALLFCSTLYNILIMVITDIGFIQAA
jgi:hypothetical protein